MPPGSARMPTLPGSLAVSMIKSSNLNISLYGTLVSSSEGTMSGLRGRPAVHLRPSTRKNRGDSRTSAFHETLEACVNSAFATRWAGSHTLEDDLDVQPIALCVLLPCTLDSWCGIDKSPIHVKKAKRYWRVQQPIQLCMRHHSHGIEVVRVRGVEDSHFGDDDSDLSLMVLDER